MYLTQLPHSTFSKDDLISVEQYSAQMFIALSLPQKPNGIKFKNNQERLLPPSMLFQFD